MGKRGYEKHILWWLRDGLCGIFVGAGAILPGVSGGVLAVVFDIYRPFMETLTHPRTALPRYWRRFVPVGLGGVVGFFALAGAISFCMEHYAVMTVWGFIGLILGTVPSLYREAGKEGRGVSAWAALAVSFLLMGGGLTLLGSVTGAAVEPNFGWYNVCGALWGAGVVIPGLSSSPIMMALGLYEPMLEDLATMDVPVLASCVPGFLVTVLVLARLVTWLMKHCYAAAFHAILGIVLASTVSIIPLDYQAGELLPSLLCACAGAGLAYGMDRLDRKYPRQSGR